MDKLWAKVFTLTNIIRPAKQADIGRQVMESSDVGC